MGCRYRYAIRGREPCERFARLCPAGTRLSLRDTPRVASLCPAGIRLGLGGYPATRNTPPNDDWHLTLSAFIAMHSVFARKIFTRFFLWALVSACSMSIHQADLAAQEADDKDDESWAEIESEHFTMLFPLRREAFARHTLVYAEHAYAVLTKKLDVEIDFKISIRVIDRVDEVLPLSESAQSSSFVLTTWPPQGLLDGPYRGDWLERTVYQHVAFILIHQTRADVSPFLATLLYPLVYNNQFVPSWYAHGLSSWYETPEAPGRVVQDPVSQSLLRSDALDDEIPQLESIMSGRRSWIAERASSIYGVAFLSDLAQKHGEDIFTRWNHENAQMLVPFTVDLTTLGIFGDSWGTLYEEWQADAATEVAQREWKEKNNIAGTLITDAWKHEYPQAIPGRNAISYVHEDGVSARSIVWLDLESKESKEIAECNGQCEHHWSPDGKTLFFTDMVYKERQSTETLYYRRLSDVFSQKVDMPGHVRSFAVGPDAVYAVIMDGDAPQIYRTRLEPGAKAEIVYPGKVYELIEDLVWIRDDLLVGIVSDADSRQYDIYSFRDVGDHLEPHKLTDNPITEMYPFAVRGDVGFVVETNGTYSLLAIETESGQIRSIHAQRDGIFQPVMSADGTLYYTRITAKGTGVASLLPEQMHPTDIPEMHATIAAPISKLYAAEAETVESLESTPYQVWTAFIPSSVMPLAGYSGAMGLYEGIDISNDDILGHHAYNLHYAYFNRRNKHEFSLEYRWSQYKWWIEASGGVRQDTYSYDTEEESLHFPNQVFWAKLQTGTEWHFPYLDIHLKLQYLLEYNQMLNQESFADLIDFVNELILEYAAETGTPADLITYNSISRPDRTSAIIGELSFRHVHKAYRTIPGETGYIFDMLFRVEAPFLLADYYTFINEFALTMSWSLPWIETHVFLLKMKYGFSSSENELRNGFQIDSSSGFDFDFNSSSTMMHGYRTGNILANNILYAHAEYTLPIYEIRGWLSYIPLGLNRIGAGVFGEIAHVWNDYTMEEFRRNTPMVGIGAEIHLDGTLGYNHDFRLTLGYAYGFMDSGDHSYYLNATIQP